MRGSFVVLCVGLAGGFSSTGCKSKAAKPAPAAAPNLAATGAPPAGGPTEGARAGAPEAVPAVPTAPTSPARPGPTRASSSRGDRAAQRPPLATPGWWSTLAPGCT